MTDTVQNLILDLVEWVERTERTYEETMDAWRTSCPRLPVWEDASDRGLVERTVANGRVMVRATADGLALLEENRPEAYEALRRRSESRLGVRLGVEIVAQDVAMAAGALVGPSFRRTTGAPIPIDGGNDRVI